MVILADGRLSTQIGHPRGAKADGQIELGLRRFVDGLVFTPHGAFCHQLFGAAPTELFV